MIDPVRHNYSVRRRSRKTSPRPYFPAEAGKLNRDHYSYLTLALNTCIIALIVRFDASVISICDAHFPHLKDCLIVAKLTFEAGVRFHYKSQLYSRSRRDRMHKMDQQVSRRQFLAGTGTTLGATIMSSKLALGSEVNSKIKIGVIGCGGRATMIMEWFNAHGGFEVVAAADYFQDKVDAFGEKYNIPANKRFTTFRGYKKLLELDVDAVAILSPPYFHPEQAQAAVAAGKHVYLAKPVAVDVPGCKTIEASGKEATQKNLCFMVDFQTRANEFYIEALKRVHNGAIGDMVFGEMTYHGGRIFPHVPPGSPESRLKNWVFDKALSGDIITEQNIHCLDVMSWIMNQPPVHVTGSGSRKVRTDVGDCWDNFTLHFQYPNQVGITFSSRQFGAFDTKPDGIRNRMFGTKGVLEAHYGGKIMIRCKDFYKGGTTAKIYKTGVLANVATFHKNIMTKNCANNCVAMSVRSNLITIMGRTAAYQNRQVTWNEILRSTEKLDAKLDDFNS